MHIGIIGTGNVGVTLGRRFLEIGHAVAFGTRRPTAPEMAELAQLPHARVANPAEAAQASEVLLLSTPWRTTAEAIRGLGDLSGKILLDATNPLKASLDGLETGGDSSAGEQVAEWARAARVVKIFNTVGYNIMQDPSLGGRPATMLYCGDDAASKSIARDLAAGIGFDPVDVGPLRQSRLLEPFALLWINLAFGGYGRDIAFQLIRR